jgi:hypothetical protein
MESGKVEEVVTGRISGGLMITTDEFKSYGVLDGLGYRHEAVKHSNRQYARREAHINVFRSRVSGT